TTRGGTILAADSADDAPSARCPDHRFAPTHEFSRARPACWLLSVVQRHALTAFRFPQRWAALDRHSHRAYASGDQVLPTWGSAAGGRIGSLSINSRTDAQKLRQNVTWITNNASVSAVLLNVIARST
ncbi:MAG: hypothetical protein ABIY56_03785, partial [Dokdonella sp.]